ncbi:ABC-2 family transporter protein [Candidatus Uhrbacteria bacterium]|nr:ABC-2 family transporter protein [Candidatus Uhrbacteria bacterium]
MKWLRKYTTTFSLALSARLVYRLPFVLALIQDLIIFGSLLFFFQAFPKNAVSLPTLLTTIILNALLAPLIIHAQVMHTIADEISDGGLVNYLLRPIRYFGFWFSRSLALRSINAVIGLFIIGILVVGFPYIELLPPANTTSLLLFILLLVGGLLIAVLLDMGVGTVAFWTHRSFGPRWLMYVGMYFLSGIYTPFMLFPESARAILTHTPFAYILYTPIQAYLGNYSTWPEILSILLTQWFWVALIFTTLSLSWRAGVRSYEAYGR